MKIGLIIHELLIEGGGERQCVCLARALADRRHQVTLWTSAYDPESCFPEICEGIDVREVGRGLLPWLRWPWLLRGYLDMVHLARKVKESRQVWNPQHWPAQWGAVWLKRRVGGVVVWNCNDVPNFDLKMHHTRSVLLKLFYRLYYLLDRVQNRKIDMTLLVSNWAERDYKAIYTGTTRVVHPGMDPHQFTQGGDRAKVRSRYGYSDSDFMLLWFGIFMPHRRLEDAIEAVERLASQDIRVRLLLAGSDRSYPEYLSSLKDLVRAKRLEQQVTFVGRLPDGEVRDYYAACDAFLFPNDQQTWGLAVLEAMSCGRPVLVSRGAGVHEVLTDKVNALLFPPKNPQALAETIAAALKQPQETQAMARNGMEFVRENCTWDQFAQEVEAVCGELLERGVSSMPLGVAVQLGE